MKHPTIAIIGGESLIGREIQEVLQSKGVEASVTLIGDREEDTGKLTVTGEEPAVVSPLDRTHVATASLLILAGSAESSHKAWEIARQVDTPVIDATGALRDLSGVTLAAPLTDLYRGDSPVVIAHPAAVALTLLFRRLENVESIAATIFEPASERGRAGIDELHQQTNKLFSFQALPKEVFDAQLAYAMLPRFGLESPHSLEKIEDRIDRDLRALLDPAFPAPSVRLVQAPVFHGYSASARIRFRSAMSVDALLQRVAAENIELRRADEEPQSNTGITGHTGIALDVIRPDRQDPQAFWLWLVADNLRLTADNTVLTAIEMLP